MELKMKKIFIITIIIISAVHAESADFKSWRDTPLFCSKVEENHIPYGTYSLIRSYRTVTQLLVSLNEKIILYTDRDNQKDSEIFVSAYSCTRQIHLDLPSMQQHEFNIAIGKLIRQGDTGIDSTIPFPGGDKFIDEIKKGMKPDKKDGEYFIYLKNDSSSAAIMTINQQWKKLALCNISYQNKIPSSFYSIYIDECFDKNIKKIITEYTSVIKKTVID